MTPETEILMAKLSKMLAEPDIVIEPTCTISKSKFISGVQCHKREWLQVHRPELAAKVSEGIKKQGTLVGKAAQDAFPGGVLVDIPSYNGTFDKAVAETERLMADPNVQTIFEAAFVADGVRVRVDIIVREGDGWKVQSCPNKGVEYFLAKEAYKDEYLVSEVKSSTRVKEYHVDDVSLQAYILRRAGLKVEDTVIIHLNREDYVYDGGKHSPAKLFHIAPPSEWPTHRDDSWVKGELNAQFRVLGQPNPPDILCGAQCKEPHPCEFLAYCHEDLPIDDLVFTPIPYAGKWGIVNGLRNRGISSVRSIDPKGLTAKMQEKIAIAKRAFKVNGAVAYTDKLKTELAKLRFPIIFLDFETVAYAIPYLAGTRCWDAIPMQMSAHVMDSKRNLTHHEFLGETDGTDPRPAFIEKLLEATEGAGSIVIYSKYERTQVNQLAEWFPEYADRLHALVPKLWDMLEAIKNNVYHPRFRGSFSIKQVLPALVPDLSYEGLEIASGEDVLPAWDRLLTDKSLTPEERQRIREALLAYCAQDTFGMKRLLDVLQILAKQVI